MSKQRATRTAPAPAPEAPARAKGKRPEAPAPDAGDARAITLTPTTARRLADYAASEGKEPGALAAQWIDERLKEIARRFADMQGAAK